MAPTSPTSGSSSITFTSTATLSGGTNTFNLPIFVPYNLVPVARRQCEPFNDVNINSGTLPGGTLLSLNQIGTGSALATSFASGFTVAAGATLDVGPNVSVLIESTLTDERCPQLRHRRHTCQLNAGVIAVNGIMSATDDIFTNAGGSTTSRSTPAASSTPATAPSRCPT